MTTVLTLVAVVLVAVTLGAFGIICPVVTFDLVREGIGDSVIGTLVGGLMLVMALAAGGLCFVLATMAIRSVA